MLAVSNVSPSFKNTNAVRYPSRQYDPYAQQQLLVQKEAKKKDNLQKAGIFAQIGLAVAFITMAVTGLLKHKYEKNMLKAQEKYFQESLKELGKGTKEAVQDFSRESKEMWRNITKELNLEDLILSKNLKDNAIAIDNCIKDPSKLKLMGSDPVFSVLLYGPPGTGKTTYATAIAKKYPGSELAFLDVGTMKDMWHGGSEKKINAMIDEICQKADKLLKEYHDELSKVIDPKIVQSGDEVAIANAIETAKKAGKTIPERKRVFVLADEIDSIMMVDNSHGAKISNDMLNEFKNGFTDKLGRHSNITVFGCTNLPIDVENRVVKNAVKELDTAMLDRFELKIEVGSPDKEQLRGLIKKRFTALKDSPYVSQNLLDGAEGKNNEIAKALDIMCDLLASNPQEREFSFRKLITILKEAPRTMLHEDRLLEFKDLVNVIESQKGNFKISDAEFEAFKKQIQHLL